MDVDDDDITYELLRTLQVKHALLPIIIYIIIVSKPKVIKTSK